MSFPDAIFASAAIDATTIVAIYAAFVATASVVFQGATWRSSRTEIRLKVGPGTAPVRGPSDGGGGTIEKEGEVVFITLTNRSGHSVKIDRLWAVRADDAEGNGFVFPRPYPLTYSFQIEIGARDNRMIWVLAEGLPTDERLRWGAGTTAGDEFKTKPIVLDDEKRWEYAALESVG